MARAPRFDYMSDVEPEGLAVVEAQFERELPRGLAGRIAGDDKARRPRVAKKRKCALHIGPGKAEIGRQPLLPAVAFNDERDLLDRARRMRDPTPTEKALAVRHEAVDPELKLRLFVIAHRCVGKVRRRPASSSEEDGLRGRWRTGIARPRMREESPF